MSLVFALVLFGCSDDGIACERLAAQPQRYSSRELCIADRDEALQGEAAMRADHPTVIARCLRTSPAGGRARSAR